MIEQSIANERPKARALSRRKRKCRTNLGRFMSLSYRYHEGALSEGERERYEDLVLELGRLYRAAS